MLPKKLDIQILQILQGIPAQGGNHAAQLSQRGRLHPISRTSTLSQLNASLEDLDN